MAAPMTRLELRRQRERLARFERFLPALRLRQQQLQMAVAEARTVAAAARRSLTAAEERCAVYAAVLADPSPVDVRALARPAAVRRGTRNVAGVRIPVPGEVEFVEPRYSFFATPPWVERALEDLRAVARAGATLAAAEEAAALLGAELSRIVQRVNLFEKVEIPGARRAIQRIRIQLGDEMAVAVGRAKLARSRGAGATPAAVPAAVSAAGEAP